MSLSTVKADYLGVTHPLVDRDLVRGRVAPILEAAGCVRDANGYAAPGGGFVKFTERSAVHAMSVTGAALETLRVMGLYDEFLMALGSSEHRVTLLHACRDELRDDVPAYLQALYQRAKSGQIHLSRKAVKPTQVYQWFSPNAAGEDTGTVYLGGVRAEVRHKAYDKAHERLQRAGVVIPPTLRHELAVRSKFMPSLRDASDPTAIFYHFASPDVVPRPDGVADWVPGGVGFSLPERETRLPAEQLKRLVEISPDIRMAVKLAEQVGAGGHDYLCALLRAGCVPRKTKPH